MTPLLARVLLGLSAILAAAEVRAAVAAPPVDADGRPLIKKQGTIDVDKVETTPIVFHGTLYRFEWARKKGYFHFVEHDSQRTTPPFAHGWAFGSAFVDKDSVYVTGTKPGSKSAEVRMFVSKDLVHWEDHSTGVELPRMAMWNTSICKAADQYALAFEFNGPRGVGPDYTTRFAMSKDLRKWSIAVKECNYHRGALCLRYLDGWYYLFYLAQIQQIPPNAKKPVKFNFDDLVWEECLTRSQDLIHWQPSPLNPLMRASDDDRRIANPNLTEAQRRRIATARNKNNSDLDFCQYQGRLIINYSWGDQHGIEHLAEAVYEGSMADFLRGWFPDERAPIMAIDPDNAAFRNRNYFGASR